MPEAGTIVRNESYTLCMRNNYSFVAQIKAVPRSDPLSSQGWIWAVSQSISGFSNLSKVLLKGIASLNESFTIMSQLAHLFGIICDTERRSQ